MHQAAQSSPTGRVPGTVSDASDRALERFAAAHGITRLFGIFNNIAQLRMPERIMLYALIHGIRPRNVLEVGSAQGGSAYIVCGALDDNGLGRMVCIDPIFRFDEPTWAAVKHRVTRVDGCTPDAYAAAAAVIAPERFDFAFVDGDHTLDAVVKDIEGALPILADAAYVLLHDANHPEVQAAIEETLDRHASALLDCGQLSIEPSTVEQDADDIEVWSGFRLLRFVRDGRAGAPVAPAEVDAVAQTTPRDDALDPLTRRAMQTLVRRNHARVRELEAECARAHAESQRLWSEMQPVLQGFEERGAYIRALEERLRLSEDRRVTGASGQGGSA